MESFEEQLARHEGLRLKPYRDTVGKLTIGIGRNLDDVGISTEEAYYLCRNDVAKAAAGLLKALPWVTRLSPARHNVMLNMCFNLGLKGLLGFKTTLRAIEEGRYADAAAGMLASKWAKQVKGRAVELAEQMLRG